MIKLLFIFFIVYIGILVFLSIKTRQKEKSTSNYLLAGSKVGSVLGIFTFAATLFSTFTLIGIPDFFRSNGIGTWIFLAVSDTAMVFLIVWLGLYIRKKARSNDFQGMSGLMTKCYSNKLAGLVTFIGAFIFLIPYVSIQIRGIAIFLHATFPEALPIWGWAGLIIVIMLIYSETGGLKAIIYSDFLQGILLLVVICIVGYNCLHYFGDVKAMFQKVEEVNVKLLSVPGPNNLFTVQFLIASFLAVCMIPFTQPQVATRVIIMKDNNALFRMAVGVGVFVIIILLPTMLMGMYGAVRYPEMSTADFITQVIIKDQSEAVAAFAIIGLIAAAVSTSDSQIFALGGELRSLLKGDDQKMVFITRIAIMAFALISLVFALISSDELVLLARTSFAGTALMAPMIFSGIFMEKPSKVFMPAVTALALLVFLLSLPGIIPSFYFEIRLDLILFILLSILAVIHANMYKTEKTSV